MHYATLFITLCLTECLLRFQESSRKQCVTAAVLALVVENVLLLQTEYVAPLPEQLIPPMMKSGHLQLQKKTIIRNALHAKNVTINICIINTKIIILSVFVFVISPTVYFYGITKQS